ncbi:MAG TPA: DNA translocase FtsK 4TM domain-containing protein, partial [Hydrogenophaga sp.]
MTYSLNTLNADRAQAGPGPLARLSQEALLVLGAVALAFWLLALLSYSPADPAWSTSGSHVDVTNLGGRLGA